jgi:hypothetical protein
LLDLPELRPPDFDDAQLDSMLAKAKMRSAGFRRRTRRRRSLSGLVALALVASLVAASIVHLEGTRRTDRVAVTTSPPVVKAPSWKLVGDVTQASWQEVSPSGYEPGYGLTCPAATTCYVAEFAGADQSAPLSMAVEVTNDGGATWRQLSLPVDLATSTGLACTDATSCSLLGQDGAGNTFFVSTANGGETWTSVPGPSDLPSSFLFTDVSCTVATSCVAVGSAGDGTAGSVLSVMTTDGGESWSEASLPEDFDPLQLDCDRSAICITTGTETSPGSGSGSSPGIVLYSSDGGSTWSPASLPAGVGPVTSLSCSEASDCFATSFGGDSDGQGQSPVIVTSDGGRSWSATGTGGLPDSLLTSISCPSSSYCWVSGVVVPAGSGNAITFADAEGLLAMTADSGQSWQTAQVPEGIRAVGRVSCPDATTCFALGFEKEASGQGSFVLLSYAS